MLTQYPAVSARLSPSQHRPSKVSIPQFVSAPYVYRPSSYGLVFSLVAQAVFQPRHRPVFSLVVRASFQPRHTGRHSRLSTDRSRSVYLSPSQHSTSIDRLHTGQFPASSHRPFFSLITGQFSASFALGSFRPLSAQFCFSLFEVDSTPRPSLLQPS